MFSFMRFKSFLLVCILLQQCLSIELVPVRPQGLAKRDLTSLNLKNTESFLWENPEDRTAVLANFTVHASGSKENVLSMERFDGLLKTVSCTSKRLVLEFEDKRSFIYAQKVWDWVNGEDDHSFIMVAGAGDCGDNVARIPYRVHKIHYDNGRFIATLTVTTGKWKEVIPSYQFHAGSNAVVGNSGVSRRAEGRGISLNREFPLKFKIERAPVAIEVECDNCRTTGNIGYSFDIRQNVIGFPNAAILKIDPQGVAAIAEVKLTIESEFKKNDFAPFEHEILSIPLNGWSINNVFEVGPYLDIDAGIELVGFKGGVTVTGGAKVILNDAAYLEADLLHLNRNPKMTGWTPDFVPIKPTVAANIATTAQFYLTPKIRLKAEGLNLLGVQTGVEIKAIAVEAKIEATADTKGGICKDPKKYFGISATYSSGFEVSWTAGKSTESKPEIEKVFGSKMFKWPFETCLGCDASFKNCKFINPNAKPTTVGQWVTPTAKVKSKTTTSKKPAPTTGGKCKNSPGTCESTTKCKNIGGVSKAGFCPGTPNNIQCCNIPKGSGDYCTAGGINGVCKPTASCKSGGGASIPGHCPGAANIQCCVPKKNKPAATNKKICTISKPGLKTSGFVGECLSKSTCKGGGGTSTAGFCPGSADIQCCTYGTCKKGLAGVCEPVSSCSGTPVKGYCGGGANIQCCTHPEWNSNHPGVN